MTCSIVGCAPGEQEAGPRWAEVHTPTTFLGGSAPDEQEAAPQRAGVCVLMVPQRPFLIDPVQVGMLAWIQCCWWRWHGSSGGGGRSSSQRWRKSGGGGPSFLLWLSRRGDGVVVGPHGAGVLASRPRNGLVGGQANRLEKGHINYNLSFEAVAKITLKKLFCPPVLKVL